MDTNVDRFGMRDKTDLLFTDLSWGSRHKEHLIPGFVSKCGLGMKFESLLMVPKFYL